MNNKLSAAQIAFLRLIASNGQCVHLLPSQRRAKLPTIANLVRRRFVEETVAKGADLASGGCVEITGAGRAALAAAILPSPTKEIRHERFPGRVAILTLSETPGFYDPIGRTLDVDYYFADILVFSDQYVGDVGGFLRAESDAAYFLSGRLPPGRYPRDVKFEDVVKP